MSGPPSRGLMPLTSSLLPNVGGALQRRVVESTPGTHSRGRGDPDEPTVLADMFDSRDVDGDEDAPSPRVEELPQVKALRARMMESNRAGRSPSFTGGEEPDDAPRTYTLGQIVEMVQARRGHARHIVESGDPDGPEQLPPPRSILGQVVKAMQPKG